MELTATNRSRAYPGRSSGLIQVEMISICGFEGMFEMNRSFKKEMHEWLSGGASPCQGEGRGFESRLVLFLMPGNPCSCEVFGLFVCLER